MLKVNDSMLAEHTENPDAQGSFPEIDSLSGGGWDIGIFKLPHKSWSRLSSIAIMILSYFHIGLSTLSSKQELPGVT